VTPATKQHRAPRGATKREKKQRTTKKKPRLLLHACCGPCLLYPAEQLKDEWDVTVYFYNPNIQPRWEWQMRLETLAERCDAYGFDVVPEDYLPNVWSIEVLTGKADPAPERCARCYGLRLGATAANAALEGFDAFTTTLLVSPHQDHEAVLAAGNGAAEQHGVKFLALDFRDGYKWGVGRSKQLQMYRQHYCGCVLSLIERGQARRTANPGLTDV
jgi:predicted adenine nucleotide alpha hydrolase (AANH) superfamily ATPase